MKLDLSITRYILINSKLIGNLSEKENKTIQQLEENMGKFFFNLGVGKGFATMNKNSEEILKMDMIKNRKMTKNG